MADELAHLIKLLAGQHLGDHRPHLYGHIANYDPKTHRVRVIFPSLRDSVGAPMLSPWMPLGTVMAGNGVGMQYAPYGGATAEQPTKGEQVLIKVLDRDGGVQTCAEMTFNQKMVPPFTELKPGELGVKGPKGSMVHLQETGDIAMAAPDHNITVNCKELTCTSDVVTMDAKEVRCTGALFAGYGTGDQVGVQTHDHDEVMSGDSVTGPPVPGT